MKIETFKSKLAIFPGFMNELVFVSAERNRRASTVRTWTLDLSSFEYVPNFVNDEIRTLVMNCMSDIPCEFPSWKDKVINNTLFTEVGNEVIGLVKQSEESFALFKPLGGETYLSPKELKIPRRALLELLNYLVTRWETPKFGFDCITTSKDIERFMVNVTRSPTKPNIITATITGLKPAPGKRPPVFILYVDKHSIEGIKSLLSFINPENVNKLASNW